MKTRTCVKWGRISAVVAATLTILLIANSFIGDRIEHMLTVLFLLCPLVIINSTYIFTVTLIKLKSDKDNRKSLLLTSLCLFISTAFPLLFFVTACGWVYEYIMVARRIEESLQW